MDRRTDALELLDGPLDDPATLMGNLRDLRRVNRWLGGASLSADAIDALAAHRHEITLIDVGTGGADIPLALLKGATARGRRLSVVAIDSRPEVLAAAVLATPALAVTDGIELHVGDGRSLPFPDRSFDVAHCSLVIHHCEPAEAVALLGEMARVARLGVVVNDLDRGWIGWIGAWLMSHLLTGNRYTRQDAPLSVQRAYTADETAEMLREAGLTPVRRLRGAFRQRYAIAAVPAAGGPTGDASPDPIGAEG
jgi:ubiquinone/menaquinone biosynthesis C-methylase UbiE